VTSMQLKKVWGVMHEDDPALQPESRHVIAEIESEPTGAIEKLGIETLPKDLVVKHSETELYWKRVEAAAKSKGIPLVSLEPEESDLSLAYFNTFLADALNKSAHKNWHAYKKLQAGNPRKKYFPATSEMTKEFERERVTENRLLEVCFAIAYRRSQKMLDQAEKQGVTHAIMGQIHTEDFEKQGKPIPKPILLGGARTTAREYAKWEKLRPEWYKKHEKLVGKFEEIAKRHFP